MGRVVENLSAKSAPDAAHDGVCAAVRCGAVRYLGGNRDTVFSSLEAVLGVEVSFLLAEIFVAVPVYVWLVLLCPGLWLTAVHGVLFVEAGKMTLRLVKMNFRTVVLLAILGAAVLGAAALWDVLMWEMFGVRWVPPGMPHHATYYFCTPGEILVTAGWTLAGVYVLFFYPIFCMMACGGKLGMRSEELGIRSEGTEVSQIDKKFNRYHDDKNNL